MLRICIYIVLVFVFLFDATLAEPGKPQAVTIDVDVTLYRNHQVCLIDVRDTAGKITAIHLVPSAKDPAALDDLMVCLFWDGQQTPFIACSLPELLSLLDKDGKPVDMPELAFGKGFRIFLECVSGNGSGVKGHISYVASDADVSSMRVRFDPELGITTPQQVDIKRREAQPIRPGRGEAIAISNAGFESGDTQSWRDVSWGKGSLRVYPTGT